MGESIDAAPALRMEDVRVRRWSARLGRSTTLLDAVDWEVESGQHWVMMGPNGAGKTTLLRIAGALDHPTSGRVEILGKRLGRFDVRLLRERLGFIDERLDRSLRARGPLTALEVVRTGAFGTIAPLEELLGTDHLARADELIDLVGLAHLGDRLYRDCSQGERGRLLLARALMTDPELLLLDEPAAGLDMPSRERLLRTLDRTAARHPRMAGITVTHHLEEVPACCTHALLLREGKMLAHGPVAEILTGENVSACFDIDVNVTLVDGRFSVT